MIPILYINRLTNFEKNYIIVNIRRDLLKGHKYD